MSNKNIINYKVGQKNHDIEITNNIIQTIKKKLIYLNLIVKYFLYTIKTLIKKLLMKFFLV